MEAIIYIILFVFVICIADDFLEAIVMMTFGASIISGIIFGVNVELENSERTEQSITAQVSDVTPEKPVVLKPKEKDIKEYHRKEECPEVPAGTPVVWRETPDGEWFCERGLPKVTNEPKVEPKDNSSWLYGGRNDQ